MNNAEKCSVDGCDKPAAYRVILYDFYPHNGDSFWEQDFTCPFICTAHAIENEKTADGERKPRGFVRYRYTNQQAAQGFSIYEPIPNGTIN